MPIPLSCRAVVRIVAQRAQTMPGASLAEIHPEAIEVATCAAPAHVYAADAGSRDRWARLAAWHCLLEVRAQRAAFTDTLIAGDLPHGA